MASDSFSRPAGSVNETTSHRDDFAFSEVLNTVLAPLASLKLTVALFAMAIFIVFAGTLAQVDKDIWEVIDEYFRVPPWGGTLGFAWIDFQIFFPASFFPSKPQVPGGIWFPGGWLIGVGMFLNLIAAHLVRFKMQADGTRLISGAAVIAVGLGLTALVIFSGTNKDGFQGAPILSWETLCWMLIGGMGVLSLATLGFGASFPAERRVERWLLWSVGGILALATAVTAYQVGLHGVSDSAMRILWQLVKATVAGIVLLVGCIMVFRKRGGIVLLHGGIGLMMFSELLVGLAAVEGQMQIEEGQTVNFVRDIRTLELALIDSSDPDEDKVIVVPQSRLLSGEKISHELLPFDVKLKKYFKNSTIRKLKADEKSPATEGSGLQYIAEAVRPGAGADADSAVDIGSAYVTFSEKGSDKELGTYLLTQFLSIQDIPEKVVAGDKTWDTYLRFKRTYKPYSMHLIDVRKDDYLGTDTPRNYSSDVRLVDPTRSVDREVHIWMNNPLRFAGETFYQSGYNLDRSSGKESTTLAVVTNTGWMIPYVSCMLVAVGMLAHFAITLLRFLNRRAAAAPVFETGNVRETTAPVFSEKRQRKEARRRERAGEPVAAIEPQSHEGTFAWILPLGVVLIFGGTALSMMRPPSTPAGEMNLYEFGKIPVVYQGRAKPTDTLARNTLRVLSTKETFVDSNGEKQPAVKWLLDLIAKPQEAFNHKVLRIEHLELLDTLGLKRRSGFRYAFSEFADKLPELTRQAELARKVPADQMSLYQKKVLELEQKIGTIDLLMQAYAHPQIRSESAREDLMEAIRRQQALAARHPPLAIPPADDEDEWQTYQVAFTKDLVQTTFANKEPDPFTNSMTEIFVAYANDDVADFNKGVDRFRTKLKADTPEQLNLSKANFESFFNHFAPFTVSMVLYVVAFIFACLAWLGWSKTLNRTSFWLIVFTLLIHTFALAARIYISGRPPVTNLYSSAVFIGWGCVVLGIVLEVIYKLGIGNVIAAVSGFATLQIASLLADSGDTFTVLQAVLDTQFWLATHVTCITFGYATTYVAGLLGILYIVRGICTPSLRPSVAKDLTRMTYGALCFSIFFSFVGTVLGGLWADDSWGRFWGWDPKENGALIIVLWNALVLHARWGGMVKDRGLAVLAVLGNIAVSWSWFGVNELGVGLHSYGFTEGVLLALGVFCLSQLAIASLGIMPKENWWSFRRHGGAT